MDGPRALRIERERLASGYDRNPLSGFGAMKQKTRLMVIMWSVLAIALLIATAAAWTASSAHAADPYARGVQSRIAPRAVPAPRIQPTPRLSGSPRDLRNPGLGTSRELQRNLSETSTCRSRCGSSCQTIACSGLNTSQCLSIRQNCRMTCSSRC
jgi:hypothetical protein